MIGVSQKDQNKIVESVYVTPSEPQEDREVIQNHHDIVYKYCI